jgi:hypothetical protein
MAHRDMPPGSEEVCLLVQTGSGGPAGAGATGIQLYFGAPVAYLALYAAGVFLLRSIVWNAADPQDRVVLLSLVRTMRLPSYMLTVKHQGQNTHNYVD